MTFCLLFTQDEQGMQQAIKENVIHVKREFPISDSRSVNLVLVVERLISFQ